MTADLWMRNKDLLMNGSGNGKDPDFILLGY